MMLLVKRKGIKRALLCMMQTLLGLPSLLLMVDCGGAWGIQIGSFDEDNCSHFIYVLCDDYAVSFVMILSSVLIVSVIQRLHHLGSLYLIMNIGVTPPA